MEIIKHANIFYVREIHKIGGVETYVYELAKKSVEINKLENRIKLINDNLNNIKKYYEGDYFDIVTVNPPYFKDIEKSLKNEDIHKSIARHEIYTNLDEIVKISCYLLKNGGYLAMVHKTSRFFDVVDVLKKYNFSINKVQLIYPKEDKESNLFMIEACKNGNNEVKFLKPMYVHNSDGTYKEEIMKIFKNKKEG